MTPLWIKKLLRSVGLKPSYLIMASLLPLYLPVEAADYKVLYRFPSGYGFKPTTTGTLVQGQDGNIYGTTPQGGPDNCGVAFKITPSGQYSEVSFCKNPSGTILWYPAGSLMLGSDGAFYGFAGDGADQTPDNLFQLKNGKLTLIAYFNDYSAASGPPVEGVDGSLYGLADGFDIGSYGYVYGFTLGSGLYKAKSLRGAGTDTQGPLLVGWDGNQYGPTYYGSLQEGGIHGQGRLFSITIDGMYRPLNKLTDFTHKPPSGRLPNGPLIRGLDGNIFGTAQDGGSAERGAVFMLQPKKPAGVKIIYSFTGKGDGSTPLSGIVLGSNGVFYGTTASGGDPTASCGTLFSLTPDSLTEPKTYNYNVEYAFKGGAAGDGCSPKSPMMLHTNGILYGLIAGKDEALVYTLDVGAPATLMLVPQAAKTGQNITILGQGLNGTTGVQFDGIPATFTPVSRTLLKATVPAGATSGIVSVTLPRGTVSSPTSYPIVP